VEQIHQAFGKQLSVLRNLLQAGSRESTVFSARLSHYNSFLVSLINLFHAALLVSRWRRGETSILEHLRHELELLEATISEEFCHPDCTQLPGEKLRSSSLNEVFAAFEKRVNEVRDQGVLVAAPTEIAMKFAGHFGALRSFVDNLNNIRSAMEGLPRFGQQQPEAKPHWDFLPTIDWFLGEGRSKGGLACGSFVLLLNGSIPWAQLQFRLWRGFTILGRPILRAGGRGDLRAFQNAFLAAIAAVCVALLYSSHPFLADKRRDEFGNCSHSFCLRFRDRPNSGM